jgi:outer membrane protein assembly factor BamB
MVTYQKIIMSPKIFLIFVLIIGFLSIFWVYSEIVNNPSHPISSGSFPVNPVWVFKGNGRVVATPVVYDDRVFIRTMHAVYALDGASGQPLWYALSSAPAELSTAPLVTNCCLIIPEIGSRISTYSIDTGEFLWRTAGIDYSYGGSGPGSIEVLASIGDLFFVARSGWALNAYLVENADNIWERNVPSRSTLYLAVDKNIVYLSASPYLRAYDIYHGSLLWEIDFRTNVGVVLLEDDRLYMAVHLSEKSILALDKNTYREIWHIKDSEIERSDVRSLILDGEILFAAADRLIAISKNEGSIIWLSDYTGWLGKPVVLGNKIYVRNIETVLYAIDKSTGLITGRLVIQADTAMQHMPERGPATLGDLLIIPFGDNRVFAYKP